ncbi:class I SAM-dependent methyltransferase [Lyngbya confervoides]|uniref:Class I SAM-dependent methyltransferase n=1 Tax=Lyngbya confervoides BDU141951 TaxID=1574623 RepID=A0ABD4T211_9CYAN|nr:class I SAM-dependent methyltransferase [Lyngbya confervoides]MCM1982538.1 class I SAM-dependent methyltransferase [Lyngbya confervoides BDU141951]
MGKKSNAAVPNHQPPRPGDAPTPWQKLTYPIAQRYDREYRGQAFDLPAEVEAMAIFQDWASGKLQNQTASPFWDLYQPKKNQVWLDIGCGLSFLIYPWRDWNASFYGQDVSSFVCEVLRSRGPQLNSKLFKGVQLGGGHQLPYPDQSFDGIVATGWSGYFDVDYWAQVFPAMKRVLKPGGTVLLDIVNPANELAEDWAILETYLGAEVILQSLEEWHQQIKSWGGKIVKTREGKLFNLYLIRFPAVA